MLGGFLLASAGAQALYRRIVVYGPRFRRQQLRRLLWRVLAHFGMWISNTSTTLMPARGFSGLGEVRRRPSAAPSCGITMLPALEA